MAYTFVFDAARRMIRVAQDHPENRHSALEVMREVRMHPEFKPDYGILCDFRQGNFSGSKLDLFNVSEVIKMFFPGQRIALVFADADREKSGNYVAMATTSVLAVQVFNTIEAAEAWLSSETLPPPRHSRVEPPDAAAG